MVSPHIGPDFLPFIRLDASTAVPANASVRLPAGTATPDISIDLARSVEWATSLPTNQYALYISAPTYACTSPSTIANAATVYISGAPVAGTNATITNAYALDCGGDVRIDGDVIVGSGTISAPLSGMRTYGLPDTSGTVVVAPTSSTSTEALFATSTAGAPAFRAIAANDLPWWVSDYSPFRRRARQHPLQGSTGRTTIGASAGSLSGTVGTTTADANGYGQTITSAASSGSIAGGPFIAASSGGDWRTSHSPAVIFGIQSGSDITSYRFICGYSSAAVGSADADGTKHSAYFRFSTNASDTGLVAVTANGSSATVSSQIASFSASTAYYLAIRASASAVEFWVGTSMSNLSLVHTATSTLPSSSTTLNAYCAATTLTNASRTITYYGSDYSSH